MVVLFRWGAGLLCVGIGVGVVFWAEEEIGGVGGWVRGVRWGGGKYSVRFRKCLRDIEIMSALIVRSIVLQPLSVVSFTVLTTLTTVHAWTSRATGPDDFA